MGDKKNKPHIPKPIINKTYVPIKDKHKQTGTNESVLNQNMDPIGDPVDLTNQ